MGVVVGVEVGLEVREDQQRFVDVASKFENLALVGDSAFEVIVQFEVLLSGSVE